jgi:transposase InsO family protein
MLPVPGIQPHENHINPGADLSTPTPLVSTEGRCPDEGLLHHSDQGSPYASEDYQKQLEASGIVCSMSRRGNCYDNAAMESWFSTFKSELGEQFESYAQAKEQSFDYIEVFYNQRRIHSSLGYLSPAEFERRYRGLMAAKAAA